MREVAISHLIYISFRIVLIRASSYRSHSLLHTFTSYHLFIFTRLRRCNVFLSSIYILHASRSIILSIAGLAQVSIDPEAHQGAWLSHITLGMLVDGGSAVLMVRKYACACYVGCILLVSHANAR